MVLTLVHCSYHKCMTVYFARVFGKLYNEVFRCSRGYKHFNSQINDFYRSIGKHQVISVNNHALDLDRLGNCRISRFVRDPRDLVISGYFYHKKGIEKWSNLIGPTPQDWKIVNGSIPMLLSDQESFSSYLRKVSLEEGLIAEIDFREKHFHSMGSWPKEDPRILCLRYEDILSNEKTMFRKLLNFYQVSILESRVGTYLAHKYSAQRQKKSGRQTRHIRDVNSNQWRKFFTPKVNEYFNDRHRSLISYLGYSVD